jgi:pSer/pThr/pTyr-binding forkhead associated (FHA) protein
MICPQCHTENRPDDKFCEQCGTPLNAPSPEGDGLGATVLATPGAPSVLVRESPEGSEVFQLGPRVVIGRLDTCDLPVDDRSVSREHARLSRLRDGYVIEDLGSTNGTLVNGQRIHEAVLLHPGDLVSVGSVEFRFETAEAARQEAEEAATPEEQAAPAPEPVVPPTMQELPPMPMDFPPLEPFAPLPETEEAEAEPAAPSPFTTAVWSERVETPPPAAPADTAGSLPATIAGPLPAAAAGPPPAPQEPAAPDSVPVAAPEATGGDAKATGGDVLTEATAAANRLTGLIEQLVHQLSDSEAQRTQLETERSRQQEERAQMQQRIDELEEVRRARDSAKRSLQQLPPPSVSGEQLRAMQDALDELIRNPRDAEVLIKFGKYARDLAAVRDEYIQMRRTVEKVAGALGVDLPE